VTPDAVAGGTPGAGAEAPASRWAGVRRTLGPGILMAGAAIGVSHLVQSTRAGADYGFQLLWLIVLVTVLKYPFFEYGHRYAIATGESLLDGYLRLGRLYLHAYLAISMVTAVISVAGVTFVTAALGAHLLAGAVDPVLVSAGLLAASAALVSVGRYRGLDLTVKAVVGVLAVTTLVAVVAAAVRGPVAPVGFQGPSPWTLATVGFLLALMGWMPLPIEASVWASLWIGARHRQSGHRPSLRESMIDFRVGYGLMAFTAVCFAVLGALVMHGSGRDFAATSAGFAGDLVGLYAESIGAWARPVIAVAAFTAMLSTTITCVDAFPRSLAVGSALALGRGPAPATRLQLLWMALVCAGALAIILFSARNLARLVDVAATLAFLAAPVFGIFNFRLIMSRHTPGPYRPPRWLQALSWTGLLFLVGFSLVFLWAWRAGLVF
jgi:Mn2+/Fe2+ NRAMP family transporter